MPCWGVWLFLWAVCTCTPSATFLHPLGGVCPWLCLPPEAPDARLRLVGLQPAVGDHVVLRLLDALAVLVEGEELVEREGRLTELQR